MNEGANYAEENQYPRFWRTKRFFRKLRYRFSRFIRGTAEARPLAIIVPWITGVYFTILDIWGDKWAWIRNHEDFHEVTFWILLAGTLILLFLRGVVRPPTRLESDETARLVISSFIERVGAIVQAKIDRFRKKIPDIRATSNKFKIITHPDEQIRVIANATVEFLRDAYGFKGDEIDITIVRKKVGGSWHYYFKYQEWNHTPADELMVSNAAAVHCLETGEQAFFPDKFEAVKSGKYRLSNRDKRRGEGSAYIYPTSFELPSGRIDAIVSIVTYGRKFCDTHETQTVNITEAFLREFSRRFEIELCLDSIKTGA